MCVGGVVHFKGFDLMKTQEGFQLLDEALSMEPCLDPLHSVSARPTIKQGIRNLARLFHWNT